MTLVDVKYCYILDAVLLLYGFILTVLYCRLRIQSQQSQKEEESRPPKKQAPEGGIYAGLSSPNTDTYETIHAKNPNV